MPDKTPALARFAPTSRTERSRPMITFRHDDENNGEAFWDHVNEYDVIHSAPISDEARDAVADFLTESTARELTVAKPIAEELLGWFATLPGWDGGPEYAPHPLTWGEAAHA